MPLPTLIFCHDVSLLYSFYAVDPTGISLPFIVPVIVGAVAVLILAITLSLLVVIWVVRKKKVSESSIGSVMVIMD